MVTSDDGIDYLEAGTGFSVMMPSHDVKHGETGWNHAWCRVAGRKRRYAGLSDPLDGRMHCMVGRWVSSRTD